SHRDLMLGRFCSDLRRRGCIDPPQWTAIQKDEWDELQFARVLVTGKKTRRYDVPPVLRSFVSKSWPRSRYAALRAVRWHVALISLLASGCGADPASRESAAGAGTTTPG